MPLLYVCICIYRTDHQNPAAGPTSLLPGSFCPRIHTALYHSQYLVNRKALASKRNLLPVEPMDRKIGLQ